MQLMIVPNNCRSNTLPLSCSLSRSYASFDLHIEFSPDEVAHWLLPRERVVDTFVVVDDSGNVTDLCSFYHLPSSIINHEKYKKLNAAYSFYNIAKTVPLKELMHDCLTMAKLVSLLGWRSLVFFGRT